MQAVHGDTPSSSEPVSSENLVHVREILKDAGITDALVVRHDVRHNRRCRQKGTTPQHSDHTLRCNAHGVSYVAIFEATNQENAVLQRLYKIDKEARAPSRVPGLKAEFDWTGCLLLLGDEEVAVRSLKNKLVIPKWPTPRAYCLKREAMPLLGYLCDGHRALGDPPSRIEDISLDFDKLHLLVERNNLYQDWQKALEAKDGVYLIRDTAGGHVYVGTTFNKKENTAAESQGVWDRWAGYATTGHNGNKLLRAHVDSAAGTAHLVISLLQVWGRREFPQAECERREGLWKEKLRSRRAHYGALGLNHN